MLHRGTAPFRHSGLHWPVLAWSGMSALASDPARIALLGYPGSYDGILTTVALATLFLGTVAASTTPDVRRRL